MDREKRKHAILLAVLIVGFIAVMLGIAFAGHIIEGIVNPR